MSHELRTPLNAVIGFSDVLEAHHSEPGGDEDFAEMAGLIAQSGAHLLNIVKDVLSVAKGIDEAKAPEEMEDVNLFDVVTYSTKTIAVEAKQKNIRVIAPMPDKDIFVRGDALRLQQLLLNLLSNAVKFNRQNGAIKVQLSAPHPGWVRCDIIDNGIGISEPNIERIMDPFVQVDSGNTRKYEGMGLGLTIVRQILGSHQGELKIRSAPGKGTVVSVYLPALTQSNSTAIRAIAS